MICDMCNGMTKYNVYRHPESKSYWGSSIFDTKEEAYAYISTISDAVVVATVKIEWEE